MAQFLAVKKVSGVGLIKEARTILKIMKLQGFRVPKIEAKGDWTLMGYKLTFEEAQAVALPLGSKLVKMGDGARRFGPTENSSMTIYSVATGDVLEVGSEFATGDLLKVLDDDGRKTRHDTPAEPPTEPPKQAKK